MKRHLTLVIGGVVLLGAASAQGDGYGAFDANGDGQVDPGEFGDAYGSDLYTTFNADGNSYVDQNEFGSGVYGLYDANDDGALSEDEFRAGTGTLYGGNYDQTYSDFDADGNGELSEGEFLDSYSPSAPFNTFDADENAQVSEDEFGEGVFGVADASGDGFLSEDEYNDAALLFGSADGSVAGGGVSRSRDSSFDPEAYPPFGDVEVGPYRPQAGLRGGALSLAYSSPNRQNVDFNVTGPGGYREDFEVGYIGLETGGDVRTVRGLAPGVYSVAATDDSLQLIETKVEVREGQRVSLTFNMQLTEDFAYNLTDYNPYGTAEVGAYGPGEATDYGDLTVNVRTGDGNAVVPELNVTGPDDYRRELEGDVTLRSLSAGPYSVAATAPGYRMAEGKVDVRLGEAAQLTLTLEPLGAGSNTATASGGN